MIVLDVSDSHEPAVASDDDQKTEVCSANTMVADKSVAARMPTGNNFFILFPPYTIIIIE